ncbi:THUMP-like domain-containing protein [Flavobacterium humi]|uniref:Class I SAM-dependent methyltransferase n=1 Tax=Flavobacterium humi TaxID=2562683 RepID=A0A4Z0LCY4_9FLAO|nr:RsmD family RNA methyltransferase [Flavobacterium humi]TGD59738.1 class I SAM-dependent methyltransferase [Flavobacterium humi]
MSFKILNTDVQDFINSSLKVNFTKTALLKNPFPDIPWNEILNQIASKSKAQEKLPTWFSQEGIMYPGKISIEQTSSEVTAKYKASVVSGESLIDLTGGFGVDDYYFSKKVKEVVHCELKAELSEIVSHNFDVLDAGNITCIQGDSLKTLQKLNRQFDWIYIDPSRRSDAKGKVFMLQDCLPNVPENLENYFLFSKNILIKTAPILDITAGLTELKNVKTVHIVALNNEVKELLWEIQQGYTGGISVKTIHFSKSGEEKFEFTLHSKPENITYSLPKKYIYEPNSAILKSGAFDLIPNVFALEKLHQHSHLYTSDQIVDFPGRVFRLAHFFEFTKKNMKEHLQEKKANITTRNFPETVENIRKKFKIKDGGDTYTFFTTDANNNKIVLICAKI